MRGAAFLLTVLALAFLAACGGGSEDSRTDAAPVEAVPTAEPAPTVAPTPHPVAPGHRGHLDGSPHQGRGRQRVDQLGGAHPVGVAGGEQGRPHRLLDVHLHQLHPHASLPEAVAREVRRPRARDHRNPHAGVRVREVARKRQGGGGGVRDRVSRRAGQQLLDVERLQQPVLAGEVPDRHGRVHPLLSLRGGQVRRDGAGDSPAAGGGRPRGCGHCGRPEPDQAGCAERREFAQPGRSDARALRGNGSQLQRVAVGKDGSLRPSTRSTTYGRIRTRSIPTPATT